MKNARGKKGFTVFELVVAISVSMVIAVFVFSFSISLTQIWEETENKVGTAIDANITLDIIAADIESALLLENGTDMFAVTATDETEAEALSGRWKTNPSGGYARATSLHFNPAQHQYGWAGSFLRFFSAAPTLNAVSYQIIRREAFTGSKVHRYLLFRSVINQEVTWGAGLNILSSNYNIGGGTDATQLTEPFLSTLLMENVVDFGVRLFIYDSSAPPSPFAPSGMRLIYPTSDYINLSSSSSNEDHAATTHQGANYAIRYPHAVEVFMRVLDETGARYIQDIEEGTGAPLSYQQIIDDHSAVYRRMVEIIKQGD